MASFPVNKLKVTQLAFVLNTYNEETGKKSLNNDKRVYTNINTVQIYIREVATGTYMYLVI